MFIFIFSRHGLPGVLWRCGGRCRPPRPQLRPRLPQGEGGLRLPRKGIGEGRVGRMNEIPYLYTIHLMIQFPVCPMFKNVCSIYHERCIFIPSGKHVLRFAVVVLLNEKVYLSCHASLMNGSLVFCTLNPGDQGTNKRRRRK